MIKLYTVKDSESNTFIAPFPQPTDRDAIDSFRYVVNEEKKSPYHKFPKDYALYNIGSFNPDSGELLPNPKNTHIKLALAADLLKKED